ncbi:MAG: hypothetical protein II453_05255 [Alphaproteobacteria bacterium]|nr:hypothetical protein [Alphaproteobacteria bacterium]
MPVVLGRNSLTQFTTSDWAGNNTTIRVISQVDENGEMLPSNVRLLSPATPVDENPWGYWFNNTATFSVNGKTFCAIVSEDPASFYQFLMDCVGKLVITIERSSNDTRYQSNNHAQNGQGNYGTQATDTYLDW